MSRILKGALNQIGRDIGKAVTNKVLGDLHSTPVRVTNSNSGKSTRRRNAKSEFAKAIDFQMSHRPSTLLNKITGAYFVLKNKREEFFEDNYLSPNEHLEYFSLLQRFGKKALEVSKVLELNEEKNSKEIDAFNSLLHKLNKMHNSSLKIAAQGCKDSVDRLKAEADQIKMGYGCIVTTIAIGFMVYAFMILSGIELSENWNLWFVGIIVILLILSYPNHSLNKRSFVKEKMELVGIENERFLAYKKLSTE